MGVDLRSKIQQRLAAGVLPREDSAVLIGEEREAMCCACDGPAPTITYRLKQGVLRFHGRCYIIWAEERRRAPRPPSTAT
jgi:hypothetical protein